MTLRRSFTILDALLLVASTAIGLALCVSFSRVIDPFPMPPMPPPPVIQAPALINIPSRRVGEYCRYMSFFLVVWTPTVLFMRLRKPRPRLRFIGRYCGTSACVAVLAVLFSDTVRVLLNHGALAARGADSSVAEADGPFEIIKNLSGTAGLAIIAAWCVLALIRRLQFDRGWIEMSGLLLATSWIVLPIFEDLLTIATLVW